MAPDDADSDRESLLLKGVLDLCALSILRAEPMHAYGLVEALRERGFEQTGYGTVYPLVTRLRRLGLVSQRPEPSDAGPARNVLSVTAGGSAALDRWRGVWADVNQRVAAVLDADSKEVSTRG